MLNERTKAARTGYNLLKRKSDAIKVMLHEVLKDIRSAKLQVGEGIQQAGIAHNEAIWCAGTFNHIVIENSLEPTCLIKTSIFNIAGVKIPKFIKEQDDTSLCNDSTDLIGLTRGGEAVQQCKIAYTNVQENIIRLATLQISLTSLDEAIRTTNRRVNALEFVIIPQLENTIRYVISELHELEREDTFRIKKVKDVRTKQATIQYEEDAKALELKEHKNSIKSPQVTVMDIKYTGLIDSSPEGDDVDTKDSTGTAEQNQYFDDVDVGNIFS